MKIIIIVKKYKYKCFYNYNGLNIYKRKVQNKILMKIVNTDEKHILNNKYVVNHLRTVFK